MAGVGRGPRFSRAELESYRDAQVPDLLPESLRLLFVGINPGLWSAALGTHFARRGNRFYPALHRAGITAWQIDASAGWSEQDRAELERRGIGITNLVPRATARADELADAELREAPARLGELVRASSPAVVAVLGVTAYRRAFRAPRAVVGKQDSPWSAVELHVVPNPSGLNAHATLDALARDFREVAQRAGVPLVP